MPGMTAVWYETRTTEYRLISMHSLQRPLHFRHRCSYGWVLTFPKGPLSISSTC